MERHHLDDLADELLRRPADVRRAAAALAALAAVPPFMRRGYPLESRRMARRAALAVAELLAQEADRKIVGENFSGSVASDRLTRDTHERAPATRQRPGATTPAEPAADALER